MGLIWLRIIFYLKGFRQFGPMFRAIEAMIYDLLQFMGIWAMIVLAFTCVSMLFFGRLAQFQTIENSIIYWFQACLAVWDLTQFNYTNTDGSTNSSYYFFGVIFLGVFVLLNVILLLNFVIAILGTTFGYFNDIKTGLYYNTLSKLTALNMWDDHYGVIFSLRLPLLTWVLLFPLIPFFFILNGDTLRVFNNFVFNLVFLPHYLFSIFLFAFLNLVYLPIGYFSFTVHLFGQSMRQRFRKQTFIALINMVVFLVVGPFFLIFSLLTNLIDFVHSLFVSGI